MINPKIPENLTHLSNKSHNTQNHVEKEHLAELSIKLLQNQIKNAVHKQYKHGERTAS